jgi:hypothetical protein
VEDEDLAEFPDDDNNNVPPPEFDEVLPSEGVKAIDPSKVF